MRGMHSGETRIITPWTAVDQWQPEYPQAYGLTPLGELINLGLDELELFFEAMHGNQYYRAKGMLDTDGVPTDFGSPEWYRAMDRLAEMKAREGHRGLDLFIAAAPGANMQILKMIPCQALLDLKNANYVGLFQWFSSYLESFSQVVGTDEEADPHLEELAKSLKAVQPEE